VPPLNLASHQQSAGSVECLSSRPLVSFRCAQQQLAALFRRQLQSEAVSTPLPASLAC
jgi:hypothetical protein